MTKRLTEILIRLFRLDHGNRRRNYAYFEALLSIAVSVLLFVMKYILGTALSSVGLLADAVHSLSDVVTSVIVILGFRLAVKPPDKEHPFGHGRAERVVSVIIACILVVVGVEFFVGGINRIREPVPIHPGWFVILFLITTIVLKELLYWISRNLGERIDSAALKTDAWHHRSDALSTVIVVAGFITFEFGWYSVDGVLGMVVAVFIAYTGINIIQESGSALIGRAPADTLERTIEALALACEGVSDVHHIHVHDYGGQLEITIHIRLASDTHLDKAHEKASEVERCIRDNVKHAEVTVHIEPRDE